MKTSFPYSGARQSFVVPPGVTSISWTLIGGAGGSCSVKSGFANTKSGKVTCTMAVTPGQTIFVRTGGGGTYGGGFGTTLGLGNGGYNGGGQGGSVNHAAAWNGGGGGGRSDVRYPTDTHADMVIAAAGSGGAAAAYNAITGSGSLGVTGGAGGGTTSSTPSGYGGGVNYQGLPANGAVAGGASVDQIGSGPPDHAGAAGSASNGSGGAGGHGSSTVSAGGGGGAGYAGGGGGGQDAATYGSGGGAGSNFCATSTSMGSITGISKTAGGGVSASGGSTINGSVVAQYKVPPFAPTNLAPSDFSLRAFDAIILFTAKYNADTDIPLNHFASNIRYRARFTSIWTVINNASTDTGIANGGTISYSMPANTLTPGIAYEWQIQSRNTALTTFGNWSASGLFSTAIVPPPPTWLSPVNGDSITKYPIPASWDAELQVAWQIQQWDTITGTNVLWDSGQVDYPVSFATISPSVLGVDCFLALRVSNGLSWSTWDVIEVIIALTPDLVPASQTGIELEVYDGITGKFIDVVPTRLTSSYTEELNGQGAGSFTVLANDPILDRVGSLIKFKNFVRVKDGGRYIGSWVMTNLKTTVISNDEGNAEVAVISGLGTLGGWWADAILYPESGNVRFGLGQNVQGDSRMFGFGSKQTLGHWYDVSDWSPATEMTTQATATHSDPTHPTGNPWAGGPANWPDGSAKWIWFRDSRSTEFSGLTYFRRTFTVGGSDLIQVQLSVSADTAFIAYMDGNEIAKGEAWQEMQQSSIFYLDPGSHTLSFVVAKNARANAISWTDPAGLLFSLAQVANTASGQVLTVLVRSDSTTRVQGFPGTAPGWTPGDILLTLYNEAKARGVTSFNWLNIALTPTLDTYGNVWQSGQEWLFAVGEGYDSIRDKMSQLAADIWIDENLALCAAPYRGVDRAFPFKITGLDQMIRALSPRYQFEFNDAPTVRNISIFGQATTNREVVEDESGSLIWFYGVFATTTFETGETWSSPMPGPVQGISGLKAAMDSTYQMYPDPDSTIGGNLAAPIEPDDGFAWEWWLSGRNYFVINMWSSTTDVNASHGTSYAPEATLTLSMSSYDTSSSVLRTRTNLCANPNFELNITGWAAATSTTSTLTQSTTHHYGGWLSSSSLRVAFAAADAPNGGCEYSVSGLTVGQKYTMSCWVWTSANAPQVGVHVLGITGFGTPTQLKSQWERITGTFTATATTHKFQLRCDVVAQTINNGSLIWVDNVLIEQADSMGSYFEGTDTIYQRTILQLDAFFGSTTVPNSDTIQYVSVPTDESGSHHYLLQWVYGVGVDFILIFRDGQQILSMPVRAGFRPVWVNGTAGLLHGATLAELCYYDQYFEPEEVQHHFNVGLGETTTVQPMVFQKAKNILSAESEQQLQAVTALVTKSNRTFFEATARSATRHEYGRIEGFFDGSSKETSDARSIAQATLRSTQVLSSATLEIYGGYTPWRDFGNGDWVWAPSDTSTELIRRRVVSLSYQEDDSNGRPRYAVELDTTSQEPERRLAKWLERVTPKGSLDGFIANAG